MNFLEAIVYVLGVFAALVLCMVMANRIEYASRYVFAVADS